MNSEKSKTSDPHRLLLNLLDKIHLKRNDKDVALSNLSIYYAWKKHLKNETVTDNLSIKIYINKVENKTPIKLKTRYYLELLTPKTMKLLGSSKR